MSCASGPKATGQIAVGWAAFNLLDLTCELTLDWFRVLASERPVARFRLGDVSVVPLCDGVAPALFWRAAPQVAGMDVDLECSGGESSEASLGEGSGGSEADGSGAAAWDDVESSEAALEQNVNQWRGG